MALHVKKIMALIPAYNEEKNIGRVIDGVKAQGVPPVVINDCSKDNTAGIANDHGAFVISHEVNRGKGGALQTGFDYALKNGYDAVITIDGDGQHDPAEIKNFIECSRYDEADIILGSRAHDVRTMPLQRRFSNYFSSRIVSWIAGQKITDTHSGYRLIKTKSFFMLGFETSFFEMETEMLLDAAHKGMKIIEVPISTIYGDETSKIRVWRDTYLFLKLINKWRKKKKLSPGKAT